MIFYKICVMSCLVLCASGCAQGDLGEIEGEDQGQQTRPDQGTQADQSSDQPVDIPDQPVLDPDQALPATCSPLLQDCPQGFKCVIDGQARAFCMQRGDDRPAGSDCEGIHQCAPGTLCVVWGGATVGRCETVCDRDAMPSTCPQQGQCNSRVSGRDDFGLCTSSQTLVCDLVTQNCAGGQDCVWRYDASSEQHIARCGRAGAIQEDAPCGEGISGTCAKGLLCVRVNGQQAQCVRACQRGASPSTCTNGRACGGDTGQGISYCN
jgi:hypothetical protein